MATSPEAGDGCLLLGLGLLHDDRFALGWVNLSLTLAEDAVPTGLEVFYRQLLELLVLQGRRRGST